MSVHVHTYGMRAHPSCMHMHTTSMRAHALYTRRTLNPATQKRKQKKKKESNNLSCF